MDWYMKGLHVSLPKVSLQGRFCPNGLAQGSTVLILIRSTTE